jgi:anti-repressor protein
MNELIKIQEKNGLRAVSARELYIKLGLDSKNWARWSLKNITNNEFAIEKEDWVGFFTKKNGNETLDFDLSLNFAKKLCMLARTEAGEKIRNYFIECEKKLQAADTSPLKIPQSLPEALRLAADLAESNQKLLVDNSEMKPKAEFFDAVMDSKTTIDMGMVAKTLNMPGIGRNNLFEKLRENNILMKNNLPFQHYVDLGWFRTVESKYQKPNGDTCINIKTVVFQKGLDGIRKVLSK